MCCTRYEGDGFHQLMRTPTLTAWLSVPPPTPVVVTQVDLRRRGVLGGSLKADGGGDRPAGFSELVLPTETDREVELLVVAEADRAPGIGTDRGALRVGGLLRDVEAERLRARLAERILRHARDLKAAERRDVAEAGA
jgi:hypothetical protein